MNGVTQWIANLWADFFVLCTGDVVFWCSAIALGGVALSICYLRAKNK